MRTGVERTMECLRSLVDARRTRRLRVPEVRSPAAPVATCVLAARRDPEGNRGASHAPDFDPFAGEFLGPPKHLLFPRLLVATEDHQVARVRAAPIHVARRLR